MTAIVRIPTQLRPLTGGDGEVAATGTTVGEVLKALDAAHPGMGERLFDEAGITPTLDAFERFLDANRP